MIVMTSVNFLPSILATYRERGVLRRMFTTPVTPRALLTADLVINLGIQIATTALIVILATGAFTASIQQPLAFIVAFLLTAAAASTLGLLDATVSFTREGGQRAGPRCCSSCCCSSPGYGCPGPRCRDWLRGVSDGAPMGGPGCPGHPGGPHRALGLRAVLRHPGGLDRRVRRAGRPLLPVGVTGPQREWQDERKRRRDDRREADMSIPDTPSRVYRPDAGLE